MTAVMSCAIAMVQLIVIGVVIGVSWVSLKGRVRRVETKLHSVEVRVTDIADNHLSEIKGVVNDLSKRMGRVEDLLNGRDR